MADLKRLLPVTMFAALLNTLHCSSVTALPEDRKQPIYISL